MNFDKNNLLLYAVTDRRWLNGQSLYSRVEEALKGGVTPIQLREKGLSRQEFLEEAAQIKTLCHSYGVPLIINDSAETAAAVNADGVHLGQDDMSPQQARKILGEHKIIGVSAHNPQEAKLAQQMGADYLGAGAVFGSSTKTDANLLGYEMLREICRSVCIPVVAIGGITAENVTRLQGSGIAGVAVVGAVFAQKETEQATRQLKHRLLQIKFN